MVLLEAALAIPALVSVAAALVWALGVAAVSLEIGDAARVAARELARGQNVDVALGEAHRAAPGADVRVEDAGDAVAVVVSRYVSAPLPILDGLGMTVTQRVSVPREWS
jgi:Flp pilus assembly protein TadG